MSGVSSSPVRDLVVGDHDINSNLKLVIYNLRHELSTFKTEYKLLQHSKQSMIDKYELTLDDKNNQIHKLEDQIGFLYKEKTDLQSLNLNSKQISEKAQKSLQLDKEKLDKEKSTLEDQLDEVDESVYNLNTKYQKTKSDLQCTVEINEQLEDRLQSLENDNNQLLKYNDELIKKLEDFTKNLNSNNMLQFNENLHLKNISLQKTNNQLQLKLDRLLQNKTSNELLRQKNQTLINKLNDYENLKLKYSALEIEKIELENKYTGFIKVFNDSGQNVDKFLDSYNHLKNMNIILEEKNSAYKTELNEYKTNLLEIEYQINNELQPTPENLTNANNVKQQEIEKLQSQAKLNVKEIEFLRSLLTKLEKVNKENQLEIVQKSTDEYLSHLERLVDENKKEIAMLKLKLSSADFTIGSKRPRVDEVFKRKTEGEISALQRLNTNLQTQIKDLETENDMLKSQMENMTLVNTKKQELHVLQLKANPFNKDQIVKQTLLDALRKENEDLHAKLNNQDLDLVPKSVFERQELDIRNLQAKLDDLVKRNIRLKQSFTKKARDILSSISNFFGFTIEFLEGSINPNELGSKIKLTSKYTDSSELQNSYIILDLPTKSLKAYGNREFKEFCQDLVEEWANDKDQVSCILSALNIKLYNKYASSL